MVTSRADALDEAEDDIPIGVAGRPLGGSGIDVSEVILGCGSIGAVGSARDTIGLGLTDDEAMAMLNTAQGMGISMLDTANTYAAGHSERVVGRWLASTGAGMTVATKVGAPVEPGQEDIDLSGDHLRQQLDASLERLALARVDLYLAHAPDDSTPIEATLSAFAELMEAGKVGAIGGCNLSATQLTAMLDTAERHGLPRYECVQNQYSLLERDDEKDVLEICAERGIAYTPHSPLCGGILSGKYTAGSAAPAGSRVALRPGPYARHLTPEALGGVRRFAHEAARRGVSCASLALAWVMSHPNVTAPLVAPRRPEQFDAVREALRLRLDEDDRAAIARTVVPEGRTA